MTKITAYKFAPRAVEMDESVYDLATKKFKPVIDMTDIEVHSVLNAITLEVEAGNVQEESWVKHFFASKKSFIQFIKKLEEYDELSRITDQWWQALACLAGQPHEEEGFISCDEITTKLLEVAEETGQLKAIK